MDGASRPLNSIDSESVRSERVRITAAFVRDVAVPTTTRIYCDRELIGFGLRVTPAGARSFVVEARIRGRSRRETLGRWPALKPEQARKDAQAWLGDVARGLDPVEAQERAKLSQTTLGQAFEEYLRLKRRRKDGLSLKGRTTADMRSVLKREFKAWSSLPLHEITRAKVEAQYQVLCETSVARANIAMRYLRAVFNFTADRKVDSSGHSLVADNPVRVLRHQWQAVGARKRVMSADQLPAWRAAVMALGEVPARETGKGRLSATFERERRESVKKYMHTVNSPLLTANDVARVRHLLGAGSITRLLGRS